MNRLTEKNINGRCYGYDINTSNIESSTVIEGIALKNCVNKLGKLEDIEENIGISLITLSKAFKEGIFILDSKYNMIRDCTDILLSIDWNNKCFYIECTGDCININQFYYFKDYGKTWAFTKEELENNK